MNPKKNKELRKKIEEKLDGTNPRWNLKTVIREEHYDLILQQIDVTGANSPSEVINSALKLLGELLEATNTQSFASALYVAQKGLQGDLGSPDIQALSHRVQPAREASRQAVQSDAEDALNGLL